MGIQFFDDSPASPRYLPFSENYVADNPGDIGKSFLVREVILARSNKGYMCNTDKFTCWLHKRSNVATRLVEALEVYVRDRYGYAIVAILDNNADKGFRLGVDPDQPCMWYGSGKKFTVKQDIPSFDTEDVNPFLLPNAPFTPENGHTDTSTSNHQSTRRTKQSKSDA